MNSCFSRVKGGTARLLGGAGLSALAFTLAPPVMAQDGTQPADDEVVIINETSPVAVAETGIVVTGSRIRRNETTSSSPLQIIDPETARRLGASDTAEIVQNSPIANGSSQITSAISSNAIANGGQGVQTVSLRGLGASRTLVLLNGRRAGPAGTRGAVTAFDLNVIPSSLVDRVEILKDGASSVYGSDAIAGVVNIFTKTDTDGLIVDGFVNTPFESGGEEYSVSAAWGKDFGRGHITLAGEYYRQNELERQDRDYLGCNYDYLFSTADGDERIDLVDPRNGELACTGGTAWGHVWAYYANNVPPTDSIFTLFQFDYPGPLGNGGGLGNFVSPAGPAVAPFDVSAPAGWFPVGSGTPASEGVVNRYHPFEQKSSVIPQTNRYTAYVDGAFELTDTIELYGEGLFNRRNTYVDGQRQFYNFGYTGQYAPGDLDDPFPGWGSAPGSVAYLSPTGILDQADQEITVDYYRGVLGFRGDITDKIGFDIHGQYSRSEGEYRLQQTLQDVISMQTDRAYGYGCAGLTTELSNRDCLQINWVDPRIMAGFFTPEEANYFSEWETGNTLYTQKFIEVSTSGRLFDLWGAGDIGFALGGVLREDLIDDQPGHITNAVVPGGDPNNPDDIVDNAFANAFSSKRTAGKQITKELFAELEVPLLADKPFFQELTLSGAARITNVKATRASDGVSDASNGNVTYKGMLNWQVNDWVRLRGTYGTSFRAPALFEQFLAGQVTAARQSSIDPCVNLVQNLADNVIPQRVFDNCVADGIPTNPPLSGAGIQASVFTSGGLGRLDPEKSRAFTASIILTPQFGADTNVALTVDYFDIRVRGEIRRLGAYDILFGCYDSENFPNDPLCDQFERGQDGNPLNVRNVRTGFVNIDEQNNRGFDFTLRVRHNLGNLGSLSLLGQATYQTKDTILDVFGADDLNGEVGDPKFTANVNLGWEKDGTTLLYGLDMVGKSSSVDQYIEDFGQLCNDDAETVTTYGGVAPCVRPSTPAVFYHRVSLTQEINDRFEITAGVSNLFDRKPPEVSGLTTAFGATPFVSQYDLVGRRAFIRAKAKF